MSGGFGLFLFIHKNDSSQAQEAADAFIQILENKEYEQIDDVLEKQSYTSLGYTSEEVVDKYDRIFNGINIHNIHASKIALKKINNNEHELSYQLSFTTPLGTLKNLKYQTKIIPNYESKFAEN
ncbi:NTF2-like N-terminal transpeptidase domain-containing protein [Siminovitchia sp. 179-K 8D1 HS]|uniref:NTF2-like N-terminal transpeptidase domain-containing protein n=1 Tax=Siminovitchia sp. 179-K 8D1 HS TaxID=3142385 RepID=UPI0039A1C599